MIIYLIYLQDMQQSLAVRAYLGVNKLLIVAFKVRDVPFSLWALGNPIETLEKDLIILTFQMKEGHDSFLGDYWNNEADKLIQEGLRKQFPYLN